MKMSLREEKNVLRTETVACCGEKGLALPGGRESEKYSERRGMLRIQPERQRSLPAREVGYSSARCSSKLSIWVT